MLLSNIELLRHIVDEVIFVLKATENKDKDQFTNDPILSRAVIRSLEIIGEATTKLDPDFKINNPHVEWRKMANTRHRLIHDYFGVDYEIVWDIIISKLPQLHIDIAEIIQSNS
ncbi:HepT-like ribonuclease domain-containing protein [Pedobacter sp. PWIIR3]